MDPLFERRELTRNVHIDSKFLTRNIHASLLAQLRMKYEGVCIPEGFVQSRSITIVDHSLGRANLIKGGIEYTVKFQADICLPHSGQVFRTKINLRSKIGLHAETAPIKILLPRDLHIGNEEFAEITEGSEIDFDVVGARFQQGDDSIVVLGKLRNVIRQDAPVVATPEAELPPLETVGESSERRTVTVATPTGGTDVRKKRVRLNATQSTNE
jgi:DNA-directed RNA polymerase subunit E'/Rpb7